MFSDPAIGAISYQLELYRWEDHFRRLRERQAADAEAAQAWAVADEVVRRYNELVAAARQYRDGAIKQVAGLEHRIKELEHENAQLREDRDAQRAKVVAYAKEKAWRILSGLE